MLSGDIGGTNVNLSIAEHKNSILLSHIQHVATKDYESFPELANDYLVHCGEEVKSACFAVAGVVNNQRVEMTNTNLVIDAKEIINQTPLESVLIINDFNAIGYATNVLDESDFLVINEGVEKIRGVRCAIGAGTGLGKSILLYNKDLGVYTPISSEGGHCDFPFSSHEEWMFFEGYKQPTMENLLSGKGLEHIYHILQKNQYSEAVSLMSAKEISLNRHDKSICSETFHWFIKFYARAVRNFALDLLATGGVFIAGGIAASNSDMFTDLFMEEFTRHPRFQYQKILKDIPVKLIKNYDISLKGAALALELSMKEMHVDE